MGTIVGVRAVAALFRFHRNTNCIKEMLWQVVVGSNIIQLIVVATSRKPPHEKVPSAQMRLVMFRGGMHVDPGRINVHQFGRDGNDLLMEIRMDLNQRDIGVVSLFGDLRSSPM